MNGYDVHCPTMDKDEILVILDYLLSNAITKNEAVDKIFESFRGDGVDLEKKSKIVVH